MRIQSFKKEKRKALSESNNTLTASALWNSESNETVSHMDDWNPGRMIGASPKDSGGPREVGDQLGRQRRLPEKGDA